MCIRDRIDTNLKDNPSISEHAIKEKTILIMSGDAIMEDKGAESFVNATGTITLQGTGFSAQIKAGTTFRILNISSVEIDVADIDTKIGTNTDPAGTTTLFAWLAKIFAAADVAAIEAKLDHATYGLAALNTDLDTLLTRLSAAKSSYLNELAPAHIPADIDTLKTRLSDYRAGLLNYLTELGAAHIPADIDTLLARLTAARASLLNYLTELSPAHIPADIDTLKTYCDILDDATNGLANIKTLIDAVEAKLDTGGLGKGLVTKALTFANNTGQVNLFTVTGDVIVRIVAVVKTTCASGGCNISVGIAAHVDAIIPVTDITLLAAQEIWHDATPSSEIEALGTMREHIVSNGNDITLNSDAADNSGAITFYCFWTALSSGATVVAA